MKRILCNSTLAIMLAGLTGCMSYAPARHDGAAVRQIVASQSLPPQVRPDPGADGAAAVAAYTNYQRSFVTPVPQTDSAAFGSK